MRKYGNLLESIPLRLSKIIEEKKSESEHDDEEVEAEPEVA